MPISNGTKPQSKSPPASHVHDSTRKRPARPRLERGVEAALTVVAAKRQIDRIQQLWEHQEYSFAVLIVWFRVEALLKLIRFHDFIKEGWPNDLSFATKRWLRMKDLEAVDPVAFRFVFQEAKSLRQSRNLIAHTGYRLEAEMAAPLGFYGEVVVAHLEAIAPNRESLFRKLASAGRKAADAQR